MVSALQLCPVMAEGTNSQNQLNVVSVTIDGRDLAGRAVKPESTISVTFDCDMDEHSEENAAKMYVEGLECIVGIDGDRTYNVSFTNAPGGVYTFVVEDGVTDNNGNTLGTDYKVTFYVSDGSGIYYGETDLRDQFTDVTSGAYYYDAIDWALIHDPQITKGTSDTTFSPDDTCKRCEVVTFLWRAFGAEKMTSENPFSDLKTSDYFYDAVLWAAENGITTGTDATHFNPNALCQREQVATFLWRASEKPSATMQVSPFADMLNKQAYSYMPVLWAYENGVTNGKTANTFAPADPCTRAQIVTFLYRALSEPRIPAEQPDRLTFQPKVSSEYMVEIFGEEMVETWFNLVDAVMTRKDTFDCPDQHTYDWVMGQFPNKCFPVLLEVIDYAWDREHSVKDGVASFTYLVPREEAAEKIAEFASLVEDVLNETMKPDYSDFEKALSLYLYFQETYTYDYKAAEDVDNGKADYLSSYRLLTGKTGICHEIANAYSYLLMQVGVDATTVMGFDHEWSYVRLNGNNYHIDPTFALSVGQGDLCYFLMTDDKRCEDGMFQISRFTYCSNYSQDYPHPDYVAGEKTFDEFQEGCFDSLDREKQILNYLTFGDFGETWEKAFYYNGF